MVDSRLLSKTIYIMSINELTKELKSITDNFKSDYMSFHDKNYSRISISNNSSYYEEKKNELIKSLIKTSNNYNGINSKDIDSLIHNYILEFELLFKSNSKS